jgi:16S rRNA (guanine527-N7)-methyltransferase
MGNGIICLKGGNVEGEIHNFRRIAEVMKISNWFQEEWFKEKNVIYVPC